MANLIVVGAQWGDEGKGKIVDLLAERFDIVVRYQGGHNAGHTVHIGDRKFVLHLVPTGIIHSDKICVIGNGVVVDLSALKQEIDQLQAQGVSCKGRLVVSKRAHVILPFHRAVERADEESRGSRRIGTTHRGIGPAYEDKMGRRGIRICDLEDRESLLGLLEAGLRRKQVLFADQKFPSLGPILDETMALFHELSEYFADSAEYLNRAMDEGMRVLFEGAQGTLLDVDHGTYPFVTASNATAGGACAGAGIGPTRIDGTIGIAKAYTTRVGEGPFPTELRGALGRQIREEGQEYGASTGRPRRCGWFDAVVVRYARLINNFDTLMITKLDVLDKLTDIEICTGYRYKGSLLSTFPPEIHVLSQVQPVYETVRGWNQKAAGVGKLEDLPPLARDYIKHLSDLVQTEISVVSTGPDRSETIVSAPGSRLWSLLSPKIA